MKYLWLVAVLAAAPVTFGPEASQAARTRPSAPRFAFSASRTAATPSGASAAALRARAARP